MVIVGLWHLGLSEMTTMCRCGHAHSQHNVQSAPRSRACDYSGYSCLCEGYKRSKDGTVDPGLVLNLEVALHENG